MTAKSYVKIVIVGSALCLAMVLCASFARYRSEQSFDLRGECRVAEAAGARLLGL